MELLAGITRASLLDLQAELDSEIAASRGWAGIVDLWCQGEAVHVAAMIDGCVAGAAEICFFGDGFCELHKLYVARACRRRGVGRGLVGEVERIAVRRGWAEIGIEVSGESRSFWLEYLEGRDVEVISPCKLVFRAAA